MYFGATQVVINPPFPVKQFGHIIQVDEIFEVHDDLHARLLYLEDEHLAWLHISVDSLGLPLKVQEEMEAVLSEYFGKQLHVTISCTHSHHCCDPENEGYLRFLIDTVLAAAKDLKIEEAGDFTVTYCTEYFDQLGTSRISHHKAESLQVDLIQIRSSEKLLADIIIHNVHPTILYALQPFFSAEYPGYVLNKLNETEPEVFHTFMQGAAGDTSTRFTRSSQDYDSVISLGDKLYAKVMEMKAKEVPCVPLKLSLRTKIIPLEHEFQPIDMGNMPDDLSEREKITIGYGQILRKQLQDEPEKLKKEIYLSCIDLGGPRIVFSPNEMFSWWRTQVDDSFCALVCYSNGDGPYMTGPGQYLLTYETFTDTITNDSKQKIVAVMNEWGKK